MLLIQLASARNSVETVSRSADGHENLSKITNLDARPQFVKHTEIPTLRTPSIYYPLR